jgi:hypothetical protein
MFIEIMALKTQTFQHGRDPLNAVQHVLDRFDPLIASVHGLYDTATQHGRIAAKQAVWDGFIRSAFTQARTPPQNAPDGTPYKVTLLDCLRGGGVSI